MTGSRTLRRLALGLWLAVAGLQPLAAAEPPPLDADRAPYAGEPFFLLTDASFGRDEPAQVRLEVNAPQALRETGGVDIVLYRVPRPLEFLQSQRNLHRIDVAARPAPEGLSNTLTHLWDNLVVKARLAWQQLFSGAARRAVTAEVPALKTPKSLREPSRFEEPPQFRPLPGFDVVQRFRYPVPWARAIAPPGVRLPGSSSEFLPPLEGNVFVPLGPLTPGLYLVEAMAGAHRAHTLLFVSDTLLVTKASAAQMLVWSAARRDGAAVPGARVVWTDGVGVLGRGSTDAQGLLRLSRAAPEASYVFGEDADGGVFIAENFYVDSEVHNTKVYAFTDRPLYRPGDAVQVKVYAREFTSATASRAVPDAPIDLALVDPTGAVLATQRLAFASAGGADTRLLLPPNARGGGYELRLAMRGELYTAAFRVADYQKPHFEITWLDDVREPRTGAPVAGRLQLRYPDGRPVAEARVGLTARVQRLSMVEGTLAYANAFPVKLAQAELRTDAQGVARYSLPAAEEPSRYLLSALATDGAAYRVRASHEVLVERAGATYALAAPRQFSAPGETVAFAITPAPGQADSAPPPASWSWRRLEDRSTAGGPVADARALTLRFAQPGSYSLTLRDAQQRVVAAATHVVAGPGQKAPPGSLQIVFDRPLYRPGDEAVALVTFSQPVAQALLTLERDQVDAAALLTGGPGRAGLRAERMNDTQWRVSVPVTAAMAPNVTFSVATLEGGELVFQNQGLAVQRERIELEITPQRAVVAPGEVVEVELFTSVGGQPVAAEVALGVVDEMIYVLQPELAPTMDEFFFHARRNNVRTTASASFIGYDLATRRLGTLPARRQVQERAIKLLERPRRDEVDTAAWMPRLRTGPDGRLRVRFTLPDALTRWRLTARALDAAGRVGQTTAWVRSDQPFYAKWSSPTWRREGDAPRATVTLFNQTGEPRQVDWAARGAGVEAGASLMLPPGASTLELPLPDTAAGAGTPLRLTLRHAGAVVDTLDTPLRREPAAWRVVREQVIDLAAGDALSLPPDARELRAALGRDPAALAFSRVAEALIAQPHGCVEQTASRMLPLGLALGALSAAQQPLAPRLAQQLSAARVSLAQMAGPQAVFGWWGRGMAADPFLTAYAYYADWRAAQALGAPLPPQALQRLLEIYAEQGANLAPLPRALVLHWMQQMGLPVASMQAALVEALMALPASPAAAGAGLAQTTSLLLARAEPLAEELAAQRDPALMLAVHGLGARAGAAARTEAKAAAQRLEATASPLLQALRLYTRPAGPDVSAPALALLDRLQGEGPGLDRAQALLWLHERLGGRLAAVGEAPGLGAPWQAVAGGTGQRLWRWPEGQPLPQRLGPLAVPAADPRAPRHAWLRYETRQAAGLPTLPVRLERTLFRVRPVSAEATPQAPGTGRLGVVLEPVAPGTPLSSNALYLDQLTLRTEQPLHRALLEAALPPGASVEPGTWGLDVQGAAGTAAQPLEAALAEATAQGYAVPVDALPARGTLTVRHLVRFAQRGRFVLPPPRVWPMYAPEAQGLDTSGRWARVVVE